MCMMVMVDRARPGEVVDSALGGGAKSRSSSPQLEDASEPQQSRISWEDSDTLVGQICRMHWSTEARTGDKRRIAVLD